MVINVSTDGGGQTHQSDLASADVTCWIVPGDSRERFHSALLGLLAGRRLMFTVVVDVKLNPCLTQSVCAGC